MQLRTTSSLIAGLLLLMSQVAFAQPVAPPTPAAPHAKATRTGPSKACTAAKRRVEKEKHALDAVKISIDRDKRTRETCSTGSMCARYDESIKALEQRRKRHETRLARFNDDAAEACPAQ